MRKIIVRKIIAFILVGCVIAFSLLAYAGLGMGTFIKKNDFSNAISFKNEQANSVSLSDFTGKPTVLVVWATWCVPCIAEMPLLDRLKLNNKDLNVIALSIDKKGVPKVAKFYKKYGIKNLDIYVDTKSIAYEKLGVKKLPFTVLYNSTGQSVGYWNTAVDFADKNVIKSIKSIK